jgi:hypothetical protein
MVMFTDEEVSMILSVPYDDLPQEIKDKMDIEKTRELKYKEKEGE